MYSMYRGKDPRARELINALRDQCMRRGLSGIKGLAVLFRGLDRDYSQAITYQEFVEGINRYGLQITQADMEYLFRHLDKDDSGTIDFRELLVQLTPPMAKCRVDVVNEVFDKLDVIKDGLLKIDDLMIVYKNQAKRHPKYTSGEWTLQEVMQNFLDSFDSKEGEEKDGIVTREEFLNYYATISSTVDDDAYFDLLMRNAWGLPNKSSVSRTINGKSIYTK